MTLLDLAITLMVVGLLAAPAMQAYHVWQEKKAWNQTQANLSGINKAIQDFYFTYGRYPCPADLTQNTNNATFGDEALAPCSATQGAAGGTLAGGVPFKALKIPSTMALDGWRNKITYVVTDAQTVTATYNGGGGVLRVDKYLKNAQNQCTTVEDPAMAANRHYILISHGANGLGAFSADGKLVEACPSVGVIPKEARNCNYMTDASFLNSMCARGTDTGVDKYDDMTLELSSAPQRIWVNSATDNDNILTMVNKVGINNTNPLVELDVVGNIRAQNNGEPPGPTLELGNAESSTYCALSNPADCMPTSVIAGDDPNMECPPPGVSPSNVASGIGGNRMNCNVKYTRATPGSCFGKYVVGFDITGAVICSLP